jgi:hypothetical protein
LLRKSREDTLEAISIYYIPLLSLFFLYVKKTLEKTEAIQELTINTRTMGTQDTERRPTKEKHNTEN